MEDVIGKLKAIMITLKTVTYRQNNAGCYRSGATIIGALKASQFYGVTVNDLASHSLKLEKVHAQGRRQPSRLI